MEVYSQGEIVALLIKISLKFIHSQQSNLQLD